MKNIVVGGVPEHFNLPWHLCIENGFFEKEKLQVSWQDFPGGTGEMCTALRENKIDLAVILTEGIVKDIAEGNPSKIAQEYIASPLLWGIHVASDSPFQKVSDLENTTAAISRKGSGSHLMAYVNAEKNAWDTSNLNFEIVKNIDGAVDALQKDTAQYFMWEQFTTKPLVDKKIFRRLGNCPTPWPCFVIAASNDYFENEKDALEKLLKVLNKCTSLFKEIPEIENLLAQRYDQKVEDIKEWLKITEWSQQQISSSELENVQEQLLRLNLIKEQLPPEDLTCQV